MNISSPRRASAYWGGGGGRNVLKHATLMAINGSLTEINIETQRVQHAQANPDVKTSKPIFHPIKPIANSKSGT